MMVSTTPISTRRFFLRAALVLAGTRGLVFPKPFGFDDVFRNPGLHQIIPHRFRASLRKVLIVLRCADVVGVAVHVEPVAVRGQQHTGNPAEQLAIFLLEVGLIEIEQEAVFAQAHDHTERRAAGFGDVAEGLFHAIELAFACFAQIRRLPAGSGLLRPRRVRSRASPDPPSRARTRARVQACRRPAASRSASVCAASAASCADSVCSRSRSASL